MTAAAVDLSDFALWRNGFPDELFAELRRTRPLFRHDLTPGVANTVQREFWVTTKHRHAVRLHRDTESFTAVDGPLIQPVAMFSSFPTIITMDPPDLNKRRKLISNAFTPRAIAKLEDGIRARAARMIDGLLAHGGGDWIEDVADALPMSVIGDIIGIPEEDRPRIFDMLRPHPEGAMRRRRGRAGRWNSSCSARSSNTRWSSPPKSGAIPADDIWSTLASAVDHRRRRRAVQPARKRTRVLLLRAGVRRQRHHQERAGHRAAGVRRQPRADRAVSRARKTVRSSAVEEVLRWASPVAYWTRTTKVDVEMDGQHIPKGERVVSMLRSANRDEEVFESPFTFDIGRQPNPHVAFGGGGPHHCLGAMLARAESARCSTNCCCAATTSRLGPAKVAYPNLATNMSIYDEMAITLTERR